eukprot:scaffold6578_cov61-Phaeocystis_antarctica.AAC.1
MVPTSRRARGGRARAARKVVATQGGWHPAERANRTARCARRGHPACLGHSPGCVGRLRRVPGWPERENPISEAAIEPPAGGFDACGARALPGRTADVAQDPYPF